jgi:hypothetical protein
LPTIDTWIVPRSDVYVCDGLFVVILVSGELPSPQLIVNEVVIFLIGNLSIVPFTIFIYSNNIYLFY